MQERISDAQYEKDLAELLGICEILEVPIVHGRIKLETFKMPDCPNSLDDIVAMVKDGALTPQVKIDKPMRSWTRNAINILTSGVCSVNSTDTATFGDGHINVKIPAESILGSASYGLQMGSNVFSSPGYGDITSGIWIGTNDGVSAWDFDDFDLDTQIAHGDAAGEMRYWNSFPYSVEWSAGTRKWTIIVKRCFTNHSGGSITVNEMGLVGSLAYTYPASQSHCLIARDVLSPGVAVGNLELFQASYTILSGAYPS